MLGGVPPQPGTTLRVGRLSQLSIHPMRAMSASKSEYGCLLFQQVAGRQDGRPPLPEFRTLTELTLTTASPVHAEIQSLDYGAPSIAKIRSNVVDKDAHAGRYETTGRIQSVNSCFGRFKASNHACPLSGRERIGHKPIGQCHEDAVIGGLPVDGRPA